MLECTIVINYKCKLKVWSKAKILQAIIYWTVLIESQTFRAPRTQRETASFALSRIRDLDDVRSGE